MDVYTIKPNIAMEIWKENLKQISAKIVKNKVKEILSSINSFNDPNGDFLQFVAATMSSLASIKLEAEEINVIDLITDIMVISSTDILISIKFAKINFKIIANNKELVKASTYLDRFVKSLCSLVANAFDGSTFNSSEHKTSAKINLCIVMELQKIFQAENFKGNKYIVQLFIKLIDADICDLEAIFSSILNMQLENPAFYHEIFSIEDDKICSDFLRYCLMIVQSVHQHDLIETVMLSEKESNFICLLIFSLAKHIEIMETNDEIYDLLVSELTEVILKTCANENNFECIEKQLIEGIIGEDYSLSVVCFNIMCQFLISIESDKVLNSYFILFQDLLLSIWTPSLEYSEHRQLFVAHILKILYKLNENSLLIKPQLKAFFEISNSQKMSENAITDISKLQNEPTAKNYYDMVDSLQSTIEAPYNEKLSKDLSELIQLIGCSDWNVFSTIVIKVIDLIIMTKDHERKMLYLLKFNPINGVKKFGADMPLEIVYKLLQMFLTFMSKANRCDGLKNYIKKSLDMLLEIDVSVRRFYLNLRMSKTVMIKEDETLISNIEDILKVSSTLKLIHVCKEPKIVHKENFNQLENLEKMLIYSKWLSNQDLSHQEIEIVNEITLNLQKISSNEIK